MTNEDPLMNDEETGEAVARYLEENPELLDGIVPPHDLWPAIESRISARVIPISAAPAHTRRRSMSWMPMLIAASALIAGSAGITYVLTMRAASRGAAPSTVATVVPAPASPNANTPGAQKTQVATVGTSNVSALHDDAPARDSEQPATHARRASAQLASHPTTSGNDEMRKTYDSEIATLHAALAARRGQLNPATVETIEQNLKVIDDAIRQSREALAKDPNSRLLNDQLDRTLAKKTGLLRAAALLPAA